jgi:hypothetical protein
MSDKLVANKMSAKQNSRKSSLTNHEEENNKPAKSRIFSCSQTNAFIDK